MGKGKLVMQGGRIKGAIESMPEVSVQDSPHYTPNKGRSEEESNIPESQRRRHL